MNPLPGQQYSQQFIAYIRPNYLLRHIISVSSIAVIFAPSIRQHLLRTRSVLIHRRQVAHIPYIHSQQTLIDTSSFFIDARILVTCMPAINKRMHDTDVAVSITLSSIHTVAYYACAVCMSRALAHIYTVFSACTFWCRYERSATWHSCNNNMLLCVGW